MTRSRREREFHTYKEWKAFGWQVTKGEKSTQRNEKGEAVFSRNQVSQGWTPRDSYEGYEYEGSWEEMIGDPEWYH